MHFSKMSDKSVALIDLVHLEESRQAVSDRFDQCLADGADIVLFDTLNDKHLFDIGQLLHEKSEKGTIFAIGSSGSEYAMARYWRENGLVDDPPEFPPIRPAEKMIVISGSAAANTAEQINYAQRTASAALHSIRTAWSTRRPRKTNATRRSERRCASQRGRNPLLFFATLGLDSPIIKKTVDGVRELGIDQSDTGKMIARQQGLILRALLEETGIGRVCVAGGDTCSYALRQLDIHSLEALDANRAGGTAAWRPRTIRLSTDCRPPQRAARSAHRIISFRFWRGVDRALSR